MSGKTKEINVEEEQEKVQQKIQQLTTEVNQISDSMNLLQQQRQEIINQLVGEKRLLDYFKGLNTK